MRKLVELVLSLLALAALPFFLVSGEIERVGYKLVGATIPTVPTVERGGGEVTFTMVHSSSTPTPTPISSERLQIPADYCLKGQYYTTGGMFCIFGWVLTGDVRTHNLWDCEQGGPREGVLETELTSRSDWSSWDLVSVVDFSCPATPALTPTSTSQPSTTPTSTPTSTPMPQLSPTPASTPASSTVSAHSDPLTLVAGGIAVVFGAMVLRFGGVIFTERRKIRKETRGER